MAKYILAGMLSSSLCVGSNPSFFKSLDHSVFMAKPSTGRVNPCLSLLGQARPGLQSLRFCCQVWGVHPMQKCSSFQAQNEESLLPGIRALRVYRASLNHHMAVEKSWFGASFCPWRFFQIARLHLSSRSG
jgi:hypothetical protein